MFRFNRIAVGLLVCGLAAGVLYAKATKIKSLTPAGPGVTENPDADGMVHMKFHDDSNPRTKINVHITGFLPSTTYGVQVDPGVTDPVAITTNPSGNGHWEFEVSFDVAAFNPTVRIFRWDGDAGNTSNVSFDELRAIGCLSGNCPVGVPCTSDSECDDGALCTADTCNSGFCFHALNTCDDGNTCTADFCDGGTGLCQHDALPGCVP
ncbi:MAG: hypothetical protein HY763_04920 [Planctomycetes bacterium]|nr:hypothetical protein [Planctomycetota bacterium]